MRTDNKVIASFQDGLDRRGEHPPKNETSKEQLEIFQECVEFVSAVSSYYFRRSTTHSQLQILVTIITSTKRIHIVLKRKPNVPSKKTKFFKEGNTRST